MNIKRQLEIGNYQNPKRSNILQIPKLSRESDQDTFSDAQTPHRQAYSPIYFSMNIKSRQKSKLPLRAQCSEAPEQQQAIPSRKYSQSREQLNDDEQSLIYRPKMKVMKRKESLLSNQDEHQLPIRPKILKKYKKSKLYLL